MISRVGVAHHQPALLPPPFFPTLLLLLSSMLVTATQDDLTGAPVDRSAQFALGVDESCDADSASGTDCALNALQFHGQKVAAGSLEATNSTGSCEAYGCNGYKPSQDCQCNAKCRKYENCCSDYQSKCSSDAETGSCKSYGCGGYRKWQSCQCNDQCVKYKNCCSDYDTTCSHEDHHAEASCRAYGCGKYNKSRSCQCNDKCEKYGNCCSDYKSSCAASAASCQTYGCGKYDKSQGCQCNDKCTKYGNCCSDYPEVCSAGDSHASCSKFGCGEYVPSQPCQCNAKCAKYENCCSDYSSTCAQHPGTGQHPTGKIYGHPSRSKQYPSYPGFTLALVEEFDTPIDLDADPIWTWSDGGLIEGQIRYVKEGIKFEDGKMKIAVSKTPAHEGCSHAETAIIPAKTLSSGEFRSKYNMFRYGRYEARIKAPSVQPGNTHINGNFVATMFTFRDGKYKHWREIDIEIIGESVDALHTNVLSADKTPEWNADMGEEKDTLVGTNLRSNFHTYAIEWLPHKITWFFDGKVIREKHGGKIPIPTMSTKVMMNTWVFDERAMFGGKHIENDHFPLHAEYDWFRFYKWNDDALYPCANMGTQCLTHDDMYLTSNNPCDGIPQEGTVYGKLPCVATCK